MLVMFQHWYNELSNAKTRSRGERGWMIECPEKLDRCGDGKLPCLWTGSTTVFPPYRDSTPMPVPFEKSQQNPQKDSGTYSLTIFCLFSTVTVVSVFDAFVTLFPTMVETASCKVWSCFVLAGSLPAKYIVRVVEVLHLRVGVHLGQASQ